jgi:hypothetical protein
MTDRHVVARRSRVCAHERHAANRGRFVKAISIARERISKRFSACIASIMHDAAYHSLGAFYAMNRIEHNQHYGKRP